MKIKILCIIELFVISTSSAPTFRSSYRTCQSCPSNMIMCNLGNNAEKYNYSKRKTEGACCYTYDKSKKCIDHGVPGNQCSPGTRSQLGQLWYSYCPTSSSCGNVNQEIISTKPQQIIEEDLAIYGTDQDFCFYNIKLNSSKVQSKDKTKQSKIKIKVNSIENMRVYIY